MGDLADLTGAGYSLVIPGHTLSPLTFSDYGEMERIFEARHIARARGAADGLESDIAKVIVQMALDDVRRGDFTYGTDDFDREAMKIQNLVLIVWMELRHRHPDITIEQVPGLLATVTDHAAARDSFLVLASYHLLKKKPVTADASPSTGGTSSDSSSKQEPPGTKSAA